MHLRFVISLILAALIAPKIFAQDKSQPTVDELVAKNIEAKGGATALHDLQSLRLTGKLIAAPFDDWQTWGAARIAELASSAWLTLRRLDYPTVRPLLETMPRDAG